MLAAIIATFVLLVFKNSNSQTAICTQKANLALMNQAAADINSHNITSLYGISEKVSTLPDFNKDPNCLYVLFQGSVSVGDVTKAQSYLLSLERIYPKNGLYSAFGAQSINTMEKDLSSEQTALKIAASETTYLSNPKYAKK